MTRSRRFMRRAAVTASLTLAASILSSCAGSRDGLATNALPDDYRTRHPITIADAEKTLDVPISAGDRKLTAGTRDVVRGFATEYRRSASSSVEILRPVGSYNEHAARVMTGEIAALLRSRGVPANRIQQTQYHAAVSDDAAPVRLRYVATTAQAGPCGQWPKDITASTFDNTNYHNFGCATQSNLAAQLSNPMDLVAPREMSPIDATQRGRVIRDYRGISTSTDANSGGSDRTVTLQLN
ncbi:CpaD family pilus assembly protein [Rhizobium sp. CFBP 8762]|uniref:CpaD family pilus assembly protein n=1 Tax=Rhizobium sp. CFBP 8762 TaxID=2775279 RepID=UPI001FD21C27|nr:CpaD family pilus assembly lipoprotein [Rhizobium sp. CFBP 8762]